MSGARPRRRGRPDVPGEEVPPVAVGEALAEIGAQLGLPPPGVLGPLLAQWPNVVGASVSEHARIRSLRRGVLTIAVDAAPWATELRYLEHELRTRAAAIIGADAVREVRVVVDPG
jgi:predicted nucleic acid-binding Zn ribbon protein